MYYFSSIFRGRETRIEVRKSSGETHWLTKSIVEELPGRREFLEDADYPPASNKPFSLLRGFASPTSSTVFNAVAEARSQSLQTRFNAHLPRQWSQYQISCVSYLYQSRPSRQHLN